MRRSTVVTGNDTPNGGASADVLRGGLGNDTLNGGVSSEVRFIQINPTGASGLAGTATTITLDGLVLTLNNVAGAPVDTDANAGQQPGYHCRRGFQRGRYCTGGFGERKPG